MLLAARVEAAGASKDAGARSAAEHLAKWGGTTTSEARRSLETSKQVGGLEQMTDTLRGGVFSRAQVDAIDGARGPVGGEPADRVGGGGERDRTPRGVRVGTPDRVSRIETALEPIIDELFTRARADGRHESGGVRVDALLILTERDQATEVRSAAPSRATSACCTWMSRR